jgi:hypothetical protein
MSVTLIDPFKIEPLVSGAFESIASATGTGSSATITFTSIPQTYQHLQIRYIGNTGRAASGNDLIGIRFNSDSGNNYAIHRLQGNGSSAAALGSTPQTYVWGLGACASPSTSTLAASIVDIHDYTSTVKNKTVRIFQGVDFNDNGTQSVVQLSSGLWLNTAAVTSISFVTNTGSNFTTGTTFALYGIKGA